MAFDDMKEFDGATYTGMRVGGHHTWQYTDAVWREQKVTPDTWDFTFASVKRRERSAPVGSGAPPGTQYHWYLLAHQQVRKIDEDSYTTFMSGLKHKIAHKRPHWRKWSCDYPDQESERDRVIRILEKALDSVRHGSSSTRVRPSAALDMNPPSLNGRPQGHQETFDEPEPRALEGARPPSPSTSR